MTELRKSSEGSVETKEIGVGVLGYGMMGKAHSHAYKDAAALLCSTIVPKLVSICGRSEAGVSEVARRFGFKRFYVNWKDVVKDPEVDIIDNTLPNDSHCEPLIEAVEMEKHVFCEKPLARNYEEALRIYRAVRNSGVVHGMGFNCRWIPAIRQAKKLIEEGQLGRVQAFHGEYKQDYGINLPWNWRVRKEKAGYGALGDIGSHIIDLARFLVGDVERIFGISKTFTNERPLPEDASRNGPVDVDDMSMALLDFENGVIGSVVASWSYIGRNNLLAFEIYGEQGAIEFNLERINELQVYNREKDDGFKRILVSDGIHPYYATWWPKGELLGTGDIYTLEIYEFLKAVAANKEFSPSFYDGVVNCAIMDSISKSMLDGKWIRIPRP
jgi:predicted dehydrogenase